MRRVGLWLEPLDTLFFRDGRPFDAAARASGGLPTPQTLAGALRTTLLATGGFRFAEFARRQRGESRHWGPVRDLLRDPELRAPGWVIEARFRGPWLAVRPEGDGSVTPLLPVPATLVRRDGKPKKRPGTWSRAEPLKPGALPGWPDDSGLLPIWRKGEPDAGHPGGFLTLEGINSFLGGGVPEDQEWFEPSDLYDFDSRIGIGVDMSTLTAAESQIYGIHLLALRHKVRVPKPDEEPMRYARWRIGFFAEILLPADAPMDAPELPDPIPFGGEGRYATASRLEEAEAVTWPRRNSVGRSLWMLASPAPFGGAGDRPEGIPIPRLRAAASGAPLAVSGWDVARNGARPTRFAVPAGAVYYVDGAWEPDRDSLCLDHEDVAQGWGFALRGVWS